MKFEQIFLWIFLMGIFPEVVRTTPVIFWTNDPNFPSNSVSLSRLSSSNLISENICSLKNSEIHLHLITVDDLKNSDVHRELKNNDKVAQHYFPNVDDDISRTLSLLPRSNRYECSHIHFQLDSEEHFSSLPAALKSVDEIVEKSQKTFLIGLTSKTISSRQRRAVKEEQNEILFSNDRTCMLYVDSLLLSNAGGRKQDGKVYELDLNTSSCATNETTNNRLVTLKLNWQNPNKTELVPMSFQAQIINRYWYIENVTIGEKFYRYFAYGMHSRMDTPPAYSYACNSAVFVRYSPETKYGSYNFSDKFYLQNFQFQPFRGDGKRFGQINYCSSFFTSGIWMGITSSLLCLGILLFGVHRLMSIKSNDRFDDPKSKPLLIKAQE